MSRAVRGGGGKQRSETTLFLMVGTRQADLYMSNHVPVCQLFRQIGTGNHGDISVPYCGVLVTFASAPSASLPAITHLGLAQAKANPATIFSFLGGSLDATARRFPRRDTT
jgi:hypothetical protein